MGVNLNPALRVRHVARYAPDATALVYEGTRIPYRRFWAGIERTAALLAAGGLRRGDRIAYLGLNSPTLLEAYFAAAHLGAVFVPVNSRLAAAELRHLLRDAGAHTLVVEEGHRPLVEEVLDGVAARRLLLVDTDPAVPVPSQVPYRWELLSTAAKEAGEPREPVHRTEGDLAVLMYTSGSTALPKGVMLTHGNLWWNTVNVDALLDTRRGDTTLAVAPMFHIGGLNAFTLGTLLGGGTVVVRRRFDPARCLDDLRVHRPASLFAVPAMYAALLRTPGFGQADLSCLRAAVVAGAPVPPPLIHEYARHGVLLQQAWGLTETAPFATHLPAAATLAKAGSAGIPMPYTEIRLIDPHDGGVITEPDTRGEVCVRGPNVTPGYWNDPEATRAALGADGWFRTGDVGELDHDGHLTIVDRAKDVIISGGENVYSAEVERALDGFPGIAEVAVVGAPCPRWGERVVAVVVLDQDSREPVLQAVREYAGRRLARYKLPSELSVIAAVPRNGSGKVDRPALRRWIAERAAAVPAR
ncbi:AMP-binding protein [Kitasatospora sp. NPDC059160]|uniref:AMP-binding protein n=1 Tax=Kitasatospora sp. NPDC059160 TaxID=3346748 RepID=UPI003676E463